MTGDDGKAAITVKLPDNLTTWQLDARALTQGDTLVGQTTYEIISSLPLLIRPVVPRFFVAGDQIQLAAVVNNNTGHDQAVQVSLDAKGITLDGPTNQRITVATGSNARVTWLGHVMDVPGADLTFKVVNDKNEGDAAKPSLAIGPNDTIPILHYTVRENGATTSGILRDLGSRTETVALPPRLNGVTGQLTIRIDPSLAAPLADSFDYLRQYPYFCIEQTVSRFLPNLSTYQALKSLNLSDPNLAQNLSIEIDKAMKKLANEQKADGSWGWYPDMQTDPLTTAYAALGLIEARNAGFPVDDTMLNKAIAYVNTQITRSIGDADWELNRQAFYLYVMARNKVGDQSQYTTLFNLRARLSDAGRAFLLMAYHERFPSDPAIKTLVNDLISAAAISASGAHWNESYDDYWNWNTDTRATALAFVALLRAAPDSDILPNVVRWLMSVRQEDHWYTTQETAWSIVGLSEWMVATNELKGNFHYSVGFNTAALADKTGVTPDTIRIGQTLQVDVNNLLKGRANRLTITHDDGTGTLYYSARFDLQLPAAQVKAASQGITLKREYFNANDLKHPVTQATVGDILYVKITIATSQDIQYFVMEDTLPSGVEAVDPTLATSSSSSEDSLWNTYRDDPYWYWGWWYFKQSEFYDSSVRLYSDYLPAGTYTYTYQIHATSAGVFQTIPTTATTFYFPEIYGRTDGTLFTIVDKQ
jgi:uncharacterized protein YfaS (alpha-2-macroglobulin family)